MTTLLGVDEAGRGPVIGPMILAGVLGREAARSRLERQGFTDSKKLSPTVREEKRAWLEKSDLEGITISFTARTIDRNSLTHLTRSGLVDLIRRATPDEVRFDAPGHPNALPAFIQQVESEFDDPPRLLGEPGADERYPFVSAASVLAKTERDRAVAELREQFGELGSGYPSDPDTRSFLRNHLGPDEPVRKHIRTRWSTFRKMLGDNHPSLFPDPHTEEG